MRKMSKFAGLFDKNASFEEKKIKDQLFEQFNWNGYRNIAGIYKGAGYSTNLADNFTASNLRNDSNPKGSILVAAKSYTDSKVKHTHYIRIGNDTAEVYFTYVSEKANQYTIDTLTSSLPANARISCSGYFGNLALMYIVSDGLTLSVGAFEPDNGKIKPFKMVFTSIKDVVK